MLPGGEDTRHACHVRKVLTRWLNYHAECGLLCLHFPNFHPSSDQPLEVDDRVAANLCKAQRMFDTSSGGFPIPIVVGL